jgi:hypothetical protein
MKIKFCDEYDTVVVELSKKELGLILMKKFGDKYGNGGDFFGSRLIGKEYSLDALESNVSAFKVAHELKRSISNELRAIAEVIERKINFGIEENKK